MKNVPKDDSGLPRARVMLFDQDGSGGDVFHGTWETLPWGVDDDECCAVTLESGQSLHVRLDGLTSRPAENRRLIKL